jgi:hypothetical protein
MVINNTRFEVIMKYFYKFLEWSNENNVEITWFFIGFLFCDLLVKIGERNWWFVLYNSIVLVLMYATRKLRM